MSYRVYPVTKTADICRDYTVKVNGEPIALHTARVSAEPINRRWPGHQREIAQTELVNFALLETDGPLTFEITPKDAFDKVEVRPRSLGIAPEIKSGVIRFTLERPAYLTVEPFGRNRALHLFVDPVAQYDADKTSPDVLYFGAGEHDAGEIVLQSGQTLFLDEGAVVYGRVTAIGAEHIRILGRGILDASRNKEEILYEANAVGNEVAVQNARRFDTVRLDFCADVEIDGVTIRDSLLYNIRPIACAGLTIRRVKLIGNWRYNSDGIDMHNCENVRISDCFIRTFDDSICVKGFDYHQKAVMAYAGRVYDSFKHVLVERCTIWNDWNKGLEIGAETRGREICDITFRNCDLIHTTYTALDCANADNAEVHDVTYEDIRVEYDEEMRQPVIQKKDGERYRNPDSDYVPPLLSVKVYHHKEYSSSGAERGKNHDFVFRDIALFGRQRPRLVFWGYDADHRTERVTVENLSWNGKKMTAADLSPEVGDFAGDIEIR